MGQSFESVDSITDVMDGDSGKQQEKDETVEEQEENAEVEEREEEEEKEAEEETLESLKERLKKAEEERDNYKKGMLSAKKQMRSLKKEEPKSDEEEDDEDKWDEDSKAFRRETIQKAEEAVLRKLHENNENKAKKQFLEANPELAEDDDLWKDVVERYAPTSKDDVDDIVEALDDAYTLVLKKRGKLQERIEKARQEGERKGLARAATANLASITGRGGSSGRNKNKGISDAAKRMASKMKVDMRQLEQEDDSSTAEIRF
jgi:hypothetical protein